MRRVRALRRAFLTILLLAAAGPLVVLAGLPWPWVLRWADPPATSLMLYRAREARRAGDSFSWVQDRVRLEELPDHLVRAVLIAEDDRFRQHRGVDWKALAEEVRWTGGDSFTLSSAADWSALAHALRYGWTHRGDIKGRSTITQQLAKNLFYTPERAPTRKLGEFVVAGRLERFLGKDRILELYLNTVELGPGVFGVGAASRHYFGVPAQRMTRFQAASLAATLPHPLSSNPNFRPGRMEWRRSLILARMSRQERPPSPAPPDTAGTGSRP